jgi:hypothetical protein
MASIQRWDPAEARHDASGELVAMTHLAVEPDDPQWGHQGLTAVTREHRGHRLGVLLKTTMIGVNDALGFVASEPEFHTVGLGTSVVEA